MKITFYSLPKKLDKAVLKKVIATVLEKEKKPKAVVEIVFLSQGQIEKLNFNYRGKKEPTDVLSFSNLGPFPGEDKNYLGELAICLSHIERNAKRFEEKPQRELARVLIHGILHLLGYNHERGGKDSKIMMSKQESYLSNLLI
ncbi:rRNA maturation RNase YbeY [Candidatus Parcubacteria bacterium]|nr:rRNA maturation RNase YbeY [Patescibacteria group bacterium]MBU4467058.1 rRNA maturation RNase YbeY [Patescibacteria group bacterium]MCG2688539.1 rRNA maturation RNase YbeY [Candidatus Parcubacteria bacterium]